MGHVGADTRAGPNAESADAALRTLRDRLPTPEPVARHDVPVAFWTYTPNGPMPSLHPIAVPGWGEISENYAGATRTQLEEVMRDFTPGHGGQLILWHGEPAPGRRSRFAPSRGTGVTGVSCTTSSTPTRSSASAPTGDAAGVDKHWRLLVLEDTGELLTPDAKAIIGQGLSRFLNVVDGLIGQGLRVLVLVTTNEEIRGLHPAVARPGRAAANIEFHRLAPGEASAWLARHGVGGEESGALTLAQLYARLEGQSPSQPLPSIGFGEG